MRHAQTALGRYGEEVAARRLTEQGLRVLERNWRCPEGELDLVALDDRTLAVCEVKTRSEHGFQQPTEALGPAKAERLRRLAERWLVERWPAHFAHLAVPALAGAGPAVPGRGGGEPSPARPAAAGDGVAGGPGPGDPVLPVLPAAEVPLPPDGVRIDLVSVISRARGAALVEHLRGVI
ncbi:YraN family protein [Kitasatospora sp. LaBMicrA B282]|uniref:YraN family protein n=1 Tax=Kitasatospora sp. LaBMicrA B282 TaxID=3420949 RepID=UPI003D0D7730